MRSPALLLALAPLAALMLVACGGDGTGDAGLDAVIEAVESDDPAAVEEFARTAAVPCTHQLGQGGPPKCPGDRPDGTEIDVFEHHACHVEWRRHDGVERLLQDLLGAADYTLYAAFETSADYPAPRESIGLAPSASRRLVAVFRDTSNPAIGAGLALVVAEDGAIVATRRTCGAGQAAAALVPDAQPDFLVAPRD
ncbi:MAG: hypothetical protein WD058_00900 [Dehalococcoidia bacterium]